MTYKQEFPINFYNSNKENIREEMLFNALKEFGTRIYKKSMDIQVEFEEIKTNIHHITIRCNIVIFFGDDD